MYPLRKSLDDRHDFYKVRAGSGFALQNVRTLQLHANKVWPVRTSRAL